MIEANVSVLAVMQWVLVFRFEISGNKYTIRFPKNHNHDAMENVFLATKAEPNVRDGWWPTNRIPLKKTLPIRHLFM